ncbi:MAG: hypothetical protein GX542_13920 [Rhodococcus sp.]|nr:hypothetical protein [Rhodococcus sp. (in: high G+C Gram-positive bacteria)]
MTWNTDVVRRTALIGLAAGLRGSLGVAAPWISALWLDGPDADRSSPRPYMAGAIAMGEIIGDKNIGDKKPHAPSRLGPASVLPRVASGAYGASVLARRSGGSVSQAFAIGVGASVLGAYVGQRWREEAAQRGLSDLHAAIAEDAVAVGSAFAATRSS